MKQIPLTRGKFTLVDDVDFELLSQWKWFAQQSGKMFVAARGQRQPGATHPTMIYMARFILAAPSGLLVDHKDGDPLNNQRSNLRLATHAQNARNRKGNRKNKFKGVHSVGTRFEARIRVATKLIYLGSFVSAELAADAYNRAALLHHGEFASLNKLEKGNNK